MAAPIGRDTGLNVSFNKEGVVMGNEPGVYMEEILGEGGDITGKYSRGRQG